MGECVCVCVCTDSPAQTSSVAVAVKVLDVNDNPPEFKPDTYFASLLEDAAIGTCFLLLNVHDKDAGEWGGQCSSNGLNVNHLTWDIRGI